MGCHGHVLWLGCNVTVATAAGSSHSPWQTAEGGGLATCYSPDRLQKMRKGQMWGNGFTRAFVFLHSCFLSQILLPHFGVQYDPGLVGHG
jgi:hypothetical protein